MLDSTKNITNKIQDNYLRFEQYFTKIDVAKESIKLILNDLKTIKKIDVFGTNQLHFIEPSCGEGVFIKELKRINENIKITGIDIDSIYQQAIVFNFLDADKNVLNIKEDEITVFFGCPPSYLTKEFIQHCETITKNSITYFLLEENQLRECIKSKLIVFSKILKNFGHNAFLLRNIDYTTQGAYLLTRIIFTPDRQNDFS
ncbi:MAG: hypothetical protein SWX82_00220 [Cyanobacteriota bacterium]|nr:hypothetical protein [Cyanobacteriota bacterium]